MSRVSLCVGLVTLFCGGVSAIAQALEIQFPVEPILFADDPFTSCEGIAFNGEGRLFVTCNRKLWEIGLQGEAREVSELYSNLGIAAIGERDLLVADFGPTNAFSGDRNSDGIVWRVAPDGEKSEAATGMGDPNFILVREDGSYLVSDDATSDIYVVGLDGNTSLYTTAVNHPNGMVLTNDGSMLYVAQMFSNIRPVVSNNAIWAIRLKDDGTPARDAKLAVRAGPEAAPDGLAMDDQGRIYIAANAEGRIWRFDPHIEEMALIAEGVFGVASLAFGQGDFDNTSLYITTTYSKGRGGKVWRVPVDAAGAPLFR